MAWLLQEPWNNFYLMVILVWMTSGVIFGFGMVFSGGCISRNLVRAGGGDLRSIVPQGYQHLR